MSVLPQLYLVRHGETAWSISGQHTGSTELTLTAAGEAQARALASRLRGVELWNETPGHWAHA